MKRLLILHSATKYAIITRRYTAKMVTLAVYNKPLTSSNPTLDIIQPSYSSSSQILKHTN